jgi:hypothetical protein
MHQQARHGDGMSRGPVIAALGLCLLLLLALAGTASAAGRSLYGTGQHLATGSIIDPAGRVWVADHAAGFCRITVPRPGSPADIDHPRFTGDPDHPDLTCLGGLRPGAGAGPDAAGAPAFFDPTPDDAATPLVDEGNSGDEAAFIPDGAAPSSDVVRVRWNPATKLFAFDGVVPMSGQRARPVATALGPDDRIYVVFQKSGTVQSFDPADPDPPVSLVGTVPAGGASSVAAGRDESGRLTVYVAEASGLLQLHPQTFNPPVASANSFTSAAPGTLSALTYDLVNDVLYAGTANGVSAADKGIDKLMRFDVDPEANVAGAAPDIGYATGFSMVGGLAIASGGNVFVHDDEALLDPAEPIGTGKMFLVGLPFARIAAGPTNAAGAPSADPAFTNDTTPAFTVSGDETLQCALRVDGGAPVATDYADCTAGPAPGTRTFTAPELAEGTYMFATRAHDGTSAGLPEGRAFTVDTTAPAAPAITAPATDGTVVDGRPTFAFTGEAGAAFRCNLDGPVDGAYVSCAAGQPFAFETAGDHTLRVRAVDRAGNVSAPSAPRAFTVDTVAPTVTIATPGENAVTGASPVFRFEAGEAGATFSCRIDEAPFAPCASPQGFTGVAAGRHTFQVRATDRVGNLGPPATRTFRVGTDAPAPDPAGTAPVLDPAPPAAPVLDAQGKVIDTRTGRALRLGVLLVPSALSRHRVRREGVRFVMRVPAGTELVRVRVVALRGRVARRVLSGGFRLVPRAGMVAMRLQAPALRRALRPGRYRLEVTPGYSRRALGATTTSRPFRVVP